MFSNLADYGIWDIPRNGFTFQRRGQRLVLTMRRAGFDARYQQSEYEEIKKQFAAAGIEVSDETTEA